MGWEISLYIWLSKFLNKSLKIVSESGFWRSRGHLEGIFGGLGGILHAWWHLLVARSRKCAAEVVMLAQLGSILGAKLEAKRLPWALLEGVLDAFLSVLDASWCVLLFMFFNFHVKKGIRIVVFLGKP